MKKIIITGYQGFIGSHVLAYFSNQNDIFENPKYHILGIDKGNTWNDISDRFYYEDRNVSLRYNDIATLEHLPDCDYIINVAAETHVGNSIENSDAFIHSNVKGVQKLLELIRRKNSSTNNRPHLIHVSTDEVYGDSDRPHLETDPLNPSNPYSSSKAAADMMIQAWARTYGITYNILRPTNNYGIGQYNEKFIPLCVSLLNRKKKIHLHNHGIPTRNWLCVHDTVSALDTVMNKGKPNEIYNVSGDTEQSNLTTAYLIIEAYNNGFVPSDWIEKYLDLSYERPGQDMRYRVDDSKLRALGWNNQKVFGEEIQEIVNYYKQNEVW